MFYLMLLLRACVFLLGLFIVIYVFISALKTFVLPRSAPDFLVRHIFRFLRVLFNMRLRFSPSYARRDAIMAVYAPLSLLTLPVAWLFCVLVGYMAMFWVSCAVHGRPSCYKYRSSVSIKREHAVHSVASV